MKSFLEFLSESSQGFNYFSSLNDLLDRLKNTKLTDPKTGLPQPLFRATTHNPDWVEVGKKGHFGTLGRGSYWGEDPSTAHQYLHQWPNSRIMTGYAKVENPLEITLSDWKKAPTDPVGYKLGVKLRSHEAMESALDKEGIDAVLERWRKVVNIRDPNKVVLSPHVIKPENLWSRAVQPPSVTSKIARPSGSEIPGASRGPRGSGIKGNLVLGALLGLGAGLYDKAFGDTPTTWGDVANQTVEGGIEGLNPLGVFGNSPVGIGSDKVDYGDRPELQKPLFTEPKPKPKPEADPADEFVIGKPDPNLEERLRQMMRKKEAEKTFGVISAK
jgi:hypothetical protein